MCKLAGPTRRSAIRPSIATVVALASVVTGVAGCANGGLGVGQPPVGSTCLVQLRRDVLGGGNGKLVASPLSVAIDDVAVGVGGRLVRVDDDWIVLARDAERDELWVPRASVLLIRVTPP